MLDGAGFAKADQPNRTITPAKLSLPISTAREVVDFFTRAFCGHIREKIGQMVEGARGVDGWPVSRIQTKKIHACFIAERHVGTNVEFGEAGQPWKRGQPARTYAAHPEGNDTQPAMVIKHIQRELRWNQGPHHLRCNRPVRKEQVMPALCHDPRSRWQGPRSMRNELKSRMHRLTSHVIVRVHRKPLFGAPENTPALQRRVSARVGPHPGGTPEIQANFVRKRIS